MRGISHTYVFIYRNSETPKDMLMKDIREIKGISLSLFSDLGLLT